jgi:hypothetical protein
MSPLRTRSLRHPRGQALVETALGTTIVVTLVAFGIYLAEVGYLSLKVQEAAISALWDGTAGKMHNLLLLSFDEAEDSMETAANRAQARYADFNGMSTVTRGDRITQSFTRADNLAVECTMGDGPEFDSAFPLLSLIYRDNNGTTCTAGADLTAINFPRDFLNNNGEGGLYKKKHLENNSGFMRVCAAGRAVGGQCQGGYAMLVDDWGLAGALESPPCNMIFQDQPFVPCPNLPFYAVTRLTYEETNLALMITPWYGAASKLAQAVMRFPSPIDEEAFFMSATGEETNFTQLPTLDERAGSVLWGTTPGSIAGFTTSPTSTVSYIRRRANGNCFLGKDCD